MNEQLDFPVKLLRANHHHFSQFLKVLKVFHLYFIFGRHEKGQRSNQNNDFRGTIQIEMLRNIAKVG